MRCVDPAPIRRVSRREYGVIVALVAAASCAVGVGIGLGLERLELFGLVLAAIAASRAVAIGWRLTRLHVPTMDHAATLANGVSGALEQGGLPWFFSVSLAFFVFAGVKPKSVVTTTVFAFVLVSGLLLSIPAFSAMWSERGRERARMSLLRWGKMTPLAYPVVFFAQTLLAFSLTTLLLTSHDVVAFKEAEPSGARIAAFYLWHFLDLVPLVNIPATLRWREPLSYTQSSIGALLLAFELIAVLPVIAVTRTYWNRAKNARSG